MPIYIYIYIYICVCVCVCVCVIENSSCSVIACRQFMQLFVSNDINGVVEKPSTCPCR